MATIMIVEDDKNTQLLTTSFLKPYFNVICANDGLEALNIFYSQQIDLIVADIMMPRMDGYTLIRTLRSQGYDVPILLLTAKHSLEDKKEGFSLGTDDYMTKPINFEELILRINALLRRARITRDKKITIGTVTIDATSYTVIINNQPIELTKKEFELLYKLISFPNTIFTKNQLLDEIWGYDSESGEETIKTHISKLRKKLGDCNEFEIVSVKGLGYKAVIKEMDNNEKSNK